MSGETEKEISAWNVDTLHAHLIVVLQERETRFIERVQALERLTDKRFEELKETTVTLHSINTAAANKAESTQNAVNVAQNEWRSSLNDLTKALISRPEFDALAKSVEAFRLEVSTKLANTVGEKDFAKNSKDDMRATVAIIIAVASVAVSAVALFTKLT